MMIDLTSSSSDSEINADLSSTDSDSSDWDLDTIKAINNSLEDDPVTSSSSYRVPDSVSEDPVTTKRSLPPWASKPASSNTDSKVSTKRSLPSTINRKPSHSNDHLDQKPQTRRVFKNGKWYTVKHDNHKKASSNQGSESDNQLIQKDTKRVLPSYLQNPSSSTSRSTLSKREIGSSQIHESFGKVNTPSWAHNDVDMKNNHGSRVLPPSMRPLVPSSQYGGQSGLSRPGVAEETVGDERLIYQVALRDLNQPVTEANLPEGLLSVPLFRHQKIALAWMIEKENSVACSGGILADDQGLGKTISIIALIQMQKSLSKPKWEDSYDSKPEPLDLDDENDKGKSPVDEVSDSSPVQNRNRNRNQKPPGGSLVVCPASVLNQWDQELYEKVSEESQLDVLIYHGGNRTKNQYELAQYDVVLTTYSIVAKEVPPKDDDNDNDDDEFSNKKRKQSHISKKKKKGRKKVGALAKVQWYRVILDEAQTIKNCSTIVSNACCALRAKKRWCLSGTPIQNSIDELFSYFRFLKCEPYSNFKSFNSQIKIPILRNAEIGNRKLQAVLKTIMLRRTKDTKIGDKPIINLPPKTVNLTTVDFSKEERAFYLKLEAESRSRYKAYQAAGTVRQNYANILLMLLRLRQACDHPLLVKGFNSESVSQISTKMARNLPKDLRVNLLKILETLNICLLCSDPPEDAVVTICGHVFCYQCVSDYLNGDDNSCPSANCKSQIGEDVVFSKATLKSCTSDHDHDDDGDKVDEKNLVFQNDYASAKIRATLEIIRSHCGQNDKGPIKAIIFSQWTRMLDLVEMSLSQHCIEYRRLDGSMSLVSRDRAVKEFNTDPEVIVMLMSLKAGNVGLNMVAASHVILLDLWWNPATEDQAIDRAHRIGQTRPVTVSRLTIKDTVEDRILALQEDKRKMVASAFGDDHSGSSRPGLTPQDLRYLFMGDY